MEWTPSGDRSRQCSFGCDVIGNLRLRTENILGSGSFRLESAPMASARGMGKGRGRRLRPPSWGHRTRRTFRPRSEGPCCLGFGQGRGEISVREETPVLGPERKPVQPVRSNTSAFGRRRRSGQPCRRKPASSDNGGNRCTPSGASPAPSGVGGTSGNTLEDIRVFGHGRIPVRSRRLKSASSDNGGGKRTGDLRVLCRFGIRPSLGCPRSKRAFGPGWEADSSSSSVLGPLKGMVLQPPSGNSRGFRVGQPQRLAAAVHKGVKCR